MYMLREFWTEFKVLIFLIGLPFALYRSFKDPIWLLAAGAYFYFGIPIREFRHIPYAILGLPYQAGFFALATLSSIRYYRLFDTWAEDEIQAKGLGCARDAIGDVTDSLKEALVTATLQEQVAGKIRLAALSATEERALEHVDKHCPARLRVAIRRAVRSTLQAAAARGEQEALLVLNIGVERRRTRGILHAELMARLPDAVDAAISDTLESTVLHNLQEEIRTDQREKSKEKQKSGLFVQAEGPLGLPMPRGPVGGLVTNVGLWLHIAFIFLTYYCAQNALYDVSKSMARFKVTCLLLIPMVAIISACRTSKHLLIFVLAWMLGTWQICMNGVTYWLMAGGRADNAGGQGGEANFLGAIIVLVAPIAFGFAVNLKNKHLRMFALFIAGCYFLGVLASGSRAGLVALIGSMGYWMINTNRKLVAAGIGALAISGFLVAAPSTFWDRMGTIMEGSDRNPWVLKPTEPSKESRIVLWNLAIDIWKRHPITGIGPLNYTNVSAVETPYTDPYKGQRGLQAHSTWLQLLAEFGIIGGLIWGGSYIFAFTCYVRARRRMTGYEGWEWFCAVCLGLEAGVLACTMTLSFNSFQWYDYIYWYMVFAPVVLQISRETGARLDWMKPGDVTKKYPPARYGPPRAPRPNF